MNYIKLTSSQIKGIEFNILKDFATFCDKHKIPYFLAYGTLLGAVRHKGFIPWDDDIDVVMLRSDYNRFSELMNKESISSHLEWRSIENGKWYEPFGKLFDIRTTAYKNENKGGLWIDVFPLDYYDEKVLKKNLLLRKIHIAKTTTHFSLNKKGMAKLFLKVLFYRKNLFDLSKNILSKALSVEKNDRISNMVWASDDRDVFDISLFENISEVSFEGDKFKTVAEWDKYLKQIYGNYMELPPENQRQSHSLDAYWIGTEPLNID